MSYGGLARLRRISQVAFLALFLFLLLRTEFPGSARSVARDVHLAYPVRLFFELDPLVALSNALAAHALYRGLLWALLVLIPTLFLGRFFCGWICPLGTIHHFFSSLPSRRKLGRQFLEANRYQPWQRTKYYVLLAVVLAVLSGTALVGWLDPISLLVRSLGLSLMPAANYALHAGEQTLARSSFPPWHIAGTALQNGLAALSLNLRQSYFRQGVFLALLFLLILVLNLRVTRFWCRAVCPLGALLGLASRWSLLGLEKNARTCTQCRRCLKHCQGGDDPIVDAPWRRSECLLCLNCADACPERSLGFKFFGRGPAVDTPNLDRRHALASAAVGLAAVPLLRSTPGFAVARDERLLRPPGSLDEGDFLQRCIRCGECMKVCPNNALHPAIAEAGPEGLWTPVLVPRIGYCEPSCVLCSQVCPTGAIWEISPKEKGWTTGTGTAASQPIRLGTAFYDRGRCLPWAMAVECIVCEEWCPASPKAIYLETAVVTDDQGAAKTVRQPRIDPERCLGCGACEYACVLSDRPAVYVTHAGESRSRVNQFLLHRGKEKAGT